MELDLANPEQIDEAVSLCKQAFGRIDCLINNAGQGLIAALEESSPEQIDHILAVNLAGPLKLTRAALPILREQSGGHIVFMSAIAALNNHEGFAVYGAAKAGIEAAAEALKAEVSPLGIAVTLVEPRSLSEPISSPGISRMR